MNRSFTYANAPGQRGADDGAQDGVEVAQAQTPTISCAIAVMRV